MKKFLKTVSCLKDPTILKISQSEPIGVESLQNRTHHDHYAMRSSKLIHLCIMEIPKKKKKRKKGQGQDRSHRREILRDHPF